MKKISTLFKKDPNDLKDRSFEAIKNFLSTMNIEGLVFHHEDGRMCKIRKKILVLNVKTR